MNIEAIAKAIFKVDYAGEPTYKTFSKLDPEDRQWYCDMAKAAVEALGLTEEMTMEQEFIPVELSPYAGHVRPAGWLKLSRLVSPWVRVD